MVTVENENKELMAYLIMLLILSLAAGIIGMLPGGRQFITYNLTLPAPVVAIINMAIALFLYGLIGLYGIKLSREFSLPGLLPEEYSGLLYWLEPLASGILLGGLFIFLDLSFAPVHQLGYLPHPDLPVAFFSVITSAIGIELLYRLFLIPFLGYLIISLWRTFGGRGLASRKRILERIYWPLAGVSALIFTASHFPNILFNHGVETIGQTPPMLILQLLLMYGSLSLLAAWQFKRNGFLAAVQVHFWLALLWQIGWGVVV